MTAPGVIEQGQCFVQVSTPSLENCFSKHGSRFLETKTLHVVKGLVVIGKNPCLHPGDVRILEAVDVPARLLRVKDLIQMKLLEVT
jgi:RNA-dependent RNA polymerase